LVGNEFGAGLKSVAADRVTIVGSRVERLGEVSTTVGCL